MPCVTTPIGAESLFLESVDMDHEMQRLEVVDPNDSRFYKKSVEPFKKVYKPLEEYYDYGSNVKEAAKKVHFGGSFSNWS